MKFGCILISSLGFLVFLFLSERTMAANFVEFVGWGGRCVGMGGACLALSGDASSMITNPAGIAEYDGKKLDFGMGVVLPWTEFKNPANPGGTSNKDSATNPNIAPDPLFSYFQDVKDSPFSLGLGFYCIGGAGSDYTWFSTDFDSYRDVGSAMGMFKFTPTVAYRVSGRLSIGISPNIYYMSMKKLKSTIGPVAIDMKDADAWGWGIALGILYRFNDELSVGFSYTSQSYMGDLESNDTTTVELAPSLGGKTFEYNKTEVVNFGHPQKFGVGIAYQLFPRLLVAADVKRLNYSETWDVVTIRVSDGNGPDQSFSLPFDLDDQMIYSVGLEFKATNRLALRCGYTYGSDIVAPDAIFPPVPITDAGHNLALGFGYLWDSWGLDFGWVHNFRGTTRSGVSKYAPEFDNSELVYEDNYFGLTLSYRFNS